MAKRNWERIKSLRPEETTRYRDVYEDQQLERSSIEEKQSPVSRIVIAVIVGLLAGFLMYFILSLLGSIGIGTKTNTQATEEQVVMVEVTDENGNTVQVASDMLYYTTRDTVDSASGMHTQYTPVNVYGSIIDDTVWYNSIDEMPVPDWYIQVHGDVSSSATSDAAVIQLPDTYYTVRDTVDPSLGMYEEYSAINEQGEPVGEWYRSLEEVPVPEWYTEYVASQQVVNENGETVVSEQQSSHVTIFAPTFYKVLISLLTGLAVFGILYQILMRNLDAQNLMNDTSDINQYQNDQHIALPEEIQKKFDWFPDVGAHSDVQVSSMISHMALMNKGLNKVKVSKRADKDILDEDGDIEYYKGEVLLDDEGNPLYTMEPMIDEKFMDALFEASGAPDDKRFRKYYDTTKIPYNPGGKDRTKQGGKWDTVAEMINHDWEFPSYEPQRPGGAYIVDTEPVNTMV